MGLEYYRDQLHMAVCEMAKCSGKFNERLLLAWSGYIYKFRWDEFEGMLLPEDINIFKNLKQRMVQDIHADIEARTNKIAVQTKGAENPLNDEQVSVYANAETVIRAMNGRRAKEAVIAIVEMYSAVVSTIEHCASIRANNSPTARKSV